LIKYISEKEIIKAGIKPIKCMKCDKMLLEGKGTFSKKCRHCGFTNYIEVT